MQKGITPVVAIILLLLITISIVGFSLIFFQRTTQTAGEAGEQQLQQQISIASERFSVVNNDRNRVYIKNDGTAGLSNLNFFVDDVKVDATGPASISPNSIGEFTLSSGQIPVDDEVSLKVTSAGYLDNVKMSFKNLVANGGFEGGFQPSGLGNSWFFWGGQGDFAVNDDTTTVKSGSHSQHANKPTATANSIRQDFAFPPASTPTLKLTYWIKVNSGTGRVSFGAAGPFEVDKSYPVGGWTYDSVAFIAAIGDYNLHLQYNNAGDFNIDDIKLFELYP